MVGLVGRDEDEARARSRLRPERVQNNRRHLQKIVVGQEKVFDRVTGHEDNRRLILTVLVLAAVRTGPEARLHARQHVASQRRGPQLRERQRQQLAKEHPEAPRLAERARKQRAVEEQRAPLPEALL